MTLTSILYILISWNLFTLGTALGFYGGNKSFEKQRNSTWLSNYVHGLIHTLCCQLFIGIIVGGVLLIATFIGLAVR